MDEDNSQQKRSGWPNPSRSDSQECASRTTIESEAEHLDPNFVSERIADATKDLAGIGHVPTIVQDTFSATNNLPSVSDTIDIFSAFLRPLKVFNSIADEIANVHPYAKVALGSFTCASKMILDQADHDVAISDLLSKISEVYTVRVWDMETGQPLGPPLRGHINSVESVAISLDEHHIVSGSGHTGVVCSVAISLDGNIMSGSDSKTIRTWDMETGEGLGVRLQGHTDAVCSVAISPDGNHIVSGSRDKIIRLWDAETRKAFGVPLDEHTDCVRSIVISPDGHHIVSGSDDKVKRVWI
ncbi:WD40-repeat-containing domain protein [Suillus spraguei]|nr:WD40-repeat-containing domain protein [Suillus spraguei]